MPKAAAARSWDGGSAGAKTEHECPINLSFPPGVFSLSHVALPFPASALRLRPGSLAAALSGLDAVVFTASTGPHALAIRAGICRRASWLGVDFDQAANEAGGPCLRRPGSRGTAWVIPIDERLLVARRTLAVVG
jgi:acetate kinase